MFRKKQPVKLNSRAPKWFEDWHNQYFERMKDRMSRNEKLTYLILAAIVGGSIVGGSDATAMAKSIVTFFSG